MLLNLLSYYYAIRYNAEINIIIFIGRWHSESSIFCANDCQNLIACIVRKRLRYQLNIYMWTQIITCSSKSWWRFVFFVILIIMKLIKIHDVFIGGLWMPKNMLLVIAFPNFQPYDYVALNLFWGIIYFISIWILFYVHGHIEMTVIIYLQSLLFTYCSRVRLNRILILTYYISFDSTKSTTKYTK